MSKFKVGDRILWTDKGIGVNTGEKDVKATVEEEKTPSGWYYISNEAGLIFPAREHELEPDTRLARVLK